jgi:hypothetical protein
MIDASDVRSTSRLSPPRFIFPPLEITPPTPEPLSPAEPDAYLNLPAGFCAGRSGLLVLGQHLPFLAARIMLLIKQLGCTMKILWRRLIVALILGSGIVFVHWIWAIGLDDFIVVRPYKSGYTEIYPGSIVAEDNGVTIPMPDGSREHVLQGQSIGYKVFTYGFPVSFKTSSKQLPICTPQWQIPVRIGLNVLFFTLMCFAIWSGIGAVTKTSMNAG